MNDREEERFWEPQYKWGFGSGAGSRDRVLEFKVDFVNGIIKDYGVRTIFDFGCGDSRFISLLYIKDYFGIDISKSAIEISRNRVRNMMGNFRFEIGHFWEYTPEVIRDKFSSSLDCVMCIDVLYHILDREVLVKTLENIFDSLAKVIILYTHPFGAIKKDKDLTPQGMYPRNIVPILKNIVDGYKIIKETKPVFGSGAGFIVYRKDSIYSIVSK